MTTARALFMECKRMGIALADGGDVIRIRPADKLTPELAERMKAAKPELMAVLRGDYIRAGAYLILRFADKLDQQDALADRFDQQAKASGLAIGEAERRAYIELAHYIEEEANR